MNTHMLLCGAISVTALSATISADVLELDLGRFRFNGGVSDYTYEGQWASVLGKDVEGTDADWTRTVATVDLGSLINVMGGRQIAWISIVDTGENTYLATPGADIDVFRVEGLSEETSVQYSYLGPNANYVGWGSEQFADRTALLDQRTGGGEATPWWVSLGREGALTMTFDQWPSGGSDGSGGSDAGGGTEDGEGSDDNEGTVDTNGGGVLTTDSGLNTLWTISDKDRDLDGGLLESAWSFAGLELRFNEVSPTAEWMSIRIGFVQSSSFAPVPAPGALSVIGIAIRLRRRRR
jgi:hypothetical protein